MIFTITILGSNSAAPLLNRNPTCQVVNHLHRMFMIDCGEGTQVQLARYKIKMHKINHIFISHLHGDHYFGLIGLVMTYHLFGRQTPLHIYATPELEPIIHLQLRASMTSLVYPLVFHAIDANENQVIYSDDLLEVSTLPMNHRVPTCGFLFREKLREQNLIEGILPRLGIPYEAVPAIKHGGGHLSPSGKYYENHELAYPALRARVFAGCSDTGFCESVSSLISNADLLYHEATFMHDRAAVAREKFHSTTLDAASLANQANVRKLIIGHFSARYDNLEPLLAEARSVFPETYLALEGSVFNVGE